MQQLFQVKHDEKVVEPRISEKLYSVLYTTDLAEFDLPGILELALHRADISTYGGLGEYIEMHGLDALVVIPGVGKKSVDAIKTLRELNPATFSISIMHYKLVLPPGTITANHLRRRAHESEHRYYAEGSGFLS